MVKLSDESEEKLMTQIKEIIEKLHESKYSVRRLLTDHGISPSVFYARLRKYPLLQDCYSAAQESRSELMVDEIISIADEEPDPMTARNRIDVRKWYASKMMPSKYGERVDLNITQTVDISAALNAARTRILNATPKQITQRVELIEENASVNTDTESVDANENTDIDIFS